MPKDQNITRVLSDYRKEEISDLAESIVEDYQIKGLINPETIAKEKKITFSYGNYKNAFDGLIQHISGKFHIFINQTRVGKGFTPRARFTFGHELGHYYIDEQRNALKKGRVPSHPSFNKLLSKNLAEREADYFSSCLLMPSNKFRKECFNRSLSGILIKDLSNHFKTSLSATIFRYFELNLFPMLIVYSKDSEVKWYFRSNDFIYKYPPKYGSEVPDTSVAGEFFYEKREYETEEIIYPYDWFSDFKMNKNQELFEKCYYLKSLNSVLSIVWLKE